MPGAGPFRGQARGSSGRTGAAGHGGVPGEGGPFPCRPRYPNTQTLAVGEGQRDMSEAGGPGLFPSPSPQATSSLPTPAGLRVPSTPPVPLVPMLPLTQCTAPTLKNLNAFENV